MLAKKKGSRASTRGRSAADGLRLADVDSDAAMSALHRTAPWNKAEKLRQAAARIRQQTKDSKLRFDVAHSKGVDALRRRDYGAVEAATKEERAAIRSLPSPATVRAAKPERKKPVKKR
jgi:hypothetical protein